MPTIVAKKFLLDGHSGSDTAGELSLNEKCRIEYNAFLDDVVDAITHSGFTKGQPHRNKKYLFLNSINAEAETGKEWLFSLSYTTMPAPESEDEAQKEPSVYPFAWSYTEVLEYDLESGSAFKNPAGDVLDPPIMIERTSFGFRIQKRESSFSEAKYNAVGSINNATIRIAGINCPKYCAKLSMYDPKPAYDSKGYLYWLVDYEVQILKKTNSSGDIIGFKIETLNAGFNYLDGGTKKKILIPDEDGNSVEPNEPQLLTAAGAKTTTASYTERVPLPLIDFSQFNFPAEYPKHTRYL